MQRTAIVVLWIAGLMVGSGLRLPARAGERRGKAFRPAVSRAQQPAKSVLGRRMPRETRVVIAYVANGTRADSLRLREELSQLSRATATGFADRGFSVASPAEVQAGARRMGLETLGEGADLLALGRVLKADLVVAVTLTKLRAGGSGVGALLGSSRAIIKGQLVDVRSGKSLVNATFSGRAGKRILPFGSRGRPQLQRAVLAALNHFLEPILRPYPRIAQATGSPPAPADADRQQSYQEAYGLGDE